MAEVAPDVFRRVRARFADVAPDRPVFAADQVQAALEPLRQSAGPDDPASQSDPSAPQAPPADSGGHENLRWDAVLVVDDSPSMWLWSAAVRDFEWALSTAGVFRDVLVRALGPDDGGRPALWYADQPVDPLDVGEIVDPARRRVVLVITDGVHPMWRTGEVWAPLRRWGATHPLAVVCVAPYKVAVRSGLDVHRVRLKAAGPATPNAGLDWQPQVDVPGVFDELADATPVCFTELEPVGIGRWSSLAASATGWTDVGAILVTDHPPEHVPPADTDGLVAAFRANASREAFDLAVLLAAAPLELELMARVRRRMLPDSGPVALTEFLAGPLVAPVDHDRTANRNRASYEFVSDDLRAELLGFGHRRETARVQEIVRAYYAEREPTLPGFVAELDDSSVTVPASWEQATVLADRLLKIAVAGQFALSGAHLDFGRKLVKLRPSGVSFQVGPPYQIGAGDADTGGRQGPQGAGIESRKRARELTDGQSGTTVRLGAEGLRVPEGAEGVEVTSTVDRENEERSTALSSPVFGGVPPRNPNFTGRGDLLRELERRLVRGATAAVLPEALHGMGGVGKSQLAIEYCYRNRNKFDVIWWIPAERSVKIVNSLVELGDRLNLNVGIEANVAVQQVLDALKSGRHRKVPPNWLLVFDNADSPGSVQQYLPTGGSGRILVTSRNSQWLSVARPLEVDVFHRTESVQLLRRRDDDLTEKDAGLLAAALGDLPLAIAQAAAWRVETGMPAGEYLELLAEKQAELLDVTTTLDYPKSVAAMWTLSLNQLKRKNPSALRLLQCCAFLAPEPIPRTMFTNSRHVDVPQELSRVLRDRLRLTEAIRDINRFALVRLDHRTNSIEMHRLVQAVLISQMTDVEQSEMRESAHLILGANDPDAPDDSDQWPKYADLNAHLHSSNAYESVHEAVRGLVYNQARFLYRWGEHERSADLSARIYRIWREKLGADHSETLRMGRWLGFLLWVVGKYDEAAEFNAELLETHRQKYGEEHEDTIDAFSSVTGDNRAKGNFGVALRLSEENYRNCVRYLGDEDPITLNVAHNLGVSLRLDGYYARAREQDLETWELRVQTYGQEHPLALYTEIGLTIDLRELGEYHEARVQHEGIVRAYERHGRPLDPALLRALRQLSIMRRKAGDHEGALDAADTALSGLNQRYGLNHSESLAAALCRSVELRHLGRFGKAAQLGQETLTRYAMVLGPDHPHTLAAAVNVAILRRAVGEAEGARDMNQSTLDGFRARLREDHPSILLTAINLASDLCALGEAQRACDLDTDLLRRAREVFGAEHPTTLACMANLARDLKALGRDDEADRFQRDALDGLRRKLGPDHPAVVQLSDLEIRANCDIDPLPL